ncbi:MAG: bifunctional glutamate N-acetyltransferase/amino-acid acetyltransferase ArgJ [Phycisphaeraceae bacterium]|nr:bifunctional glutamate N-acetyltransferase/amino-acid acetyltransferase ArgJ [Phycisphaeraceae bacterium]
MATVVPRAVTAPSGFLAAGTTCGIKESGKPDLALVVSERPCAAAGVFTKNKLPGAPVVVTRGNLRSGTARAIVCNSGCANDATGDEGLRNARRTCELVAERLSRPQTAPPGLSPLRATDVLPASTGVIGPQLPMDKIERGIATLTGKLGRGAGADADAAAAIMTTDLAPKTAAMQVKLGRRTVTLGGMAKGSGMIAPNMATMLVFITTDAAIAPPVLRKVLREAADVSFNRISVDQHTSPSDMLLVLANGAAGNPVIRREGTDLRKFRGTLTDLCKDLAYQIVRDGEGATKVMRVAVTRARSQKDADRVAKAIVDSPLVKTAVHGGDPNWGRVVTAAGYSGAAIVPQKMSLYIGPEKEVCVFERGRPTASSGRQARQLLRLMAGKEVVFTLDLGIGKASTQWLGCDLSRQYVAINADYRT